MDGICNPTLSRFTSSIRLFAVAAIALLITGCGMSSDTPSTPDDPGSEGHFTIRDLRISEVTDTTACVTWSTDRASVGTFQFDTQSELLTTQTMVTSLQYDHQIDLAQLLPDTRYYYRVTALSAQGDTATQRGTPFQTLRDADLDDTTAPVITDVYVAGVTSSSAEIRWTTDDPTRGAVYYDPDGAAPFDSTANEYEDEPTKYTHRHRLVLTGLRDGTSYGFAVGVTNKAGLQAYSNNLQFATLAKPTITFCPQTVTAIPGQNAEVTLCIHAASNLHAMSAVFLWERNKLTVPGRTSAVESTAEFIRDQHGHMFMVSELPDDVLLPAEWDGVLIEATWEVEYDQSGHVALGTSADGDLEVCTITIRLDAESTQGVVRVYDITTLYDHHHLPVQFATEPGLVVSP